MVKKKTKKTTTLSPARKCWYCERQTEIVLVLWTDCITPVVCRFSSLQFLLHRLFRVSEIIYYVSFPNKGVGNLLEKMNEVVKNVLKE